MNQIKILKKETNKGGIFSILFPYRFAIILLFILTIVGNSLNLYLPQLIARAIDSYGSAHFEILRITTQFFFVSLGIFLFVYLQSLVQTYTSERVARDLRSQFIAKISIQEYAFIEEASPAKLLTNLTSDIDAIKLFVSQAIATIISSLFLIVGASVLLIRIDVVLATAVLLIVPIIGGMFFFILRRVRKLFKRAQEAIDWLNKVINESILGSALVRLLNSQQSEYDKFILANTEAKDISLSILRLFATLMPVITFTTNIAILTILTLGGHFVITGEISLGDFTAFNSYLALLIFPIILIGFMSNIIAQAQASYGRIRVVLDAIPKQDRGEVESDLRGDISVLHLSVLYGERAALNDVSFEVRAGTKTAIIGPTAGGKTQLLYAITGLIKATSGTISFDQLPIHAYKSRALRRQIGFVFQDSIMFNLTVRENIAFNNTVNDADIAKAIATAELNDFIDELPHGLDTVVSERGTSLSGGQKQRIMLARALALNPKILFLDDFTARVDLRTEEKILGNVARNYPLLTLVSVTQKISPVEAYDQIILLVEGEVLATGTHKELMHASPEYVQIYESQQSTENYEL